MPWLAPVCISLTLNAPTAITLGHKKYRQCSRMYRASTKCGARPVCEMLAPSTHAYMCASRPDKYTKHTPRPCAERRMLRSQRDACSRARPSVNLCTSIHPIACHHHLSITSATLYFCLYAVCLLKDTARHTVQPQDVPLVTRWCLQGCHAVCHAGFRWPINCGSTGRRRGWRCATRLLFCCWCCLLALNNCPSSRRTTGPGRSLSSSCHVLYSPS